MDTELKRDDIDHAALETLNSTKQYVEFISLCINFEHVYVGDSLSSDKIVDSIERDNKRSALCSEVKTDIMVYLMDAGEG